MLAALGANGPYRTLRQRAANGSYEPSDSFLQSGEWPLCKAGRAKTADIFTPIA